MAKHQNRPGTPRVLGYVRVSTADQAEHGAGLPAQHAAIAAAAAARGWTLAEVIPDNGTSGSVAPSEREGLARALAILDDGQADVLIAAKVDRVSRSVLDFAELVARSDRNGWELITLDVPLDVSTPYGKLMRTMLAAFAELERDLIAMRTREALAVRRSQGVILGRPVSISAEVADRIVALRESGSTWKQVADALNEAGVPTARGGQWRGSTVRDVHARLSRTAHA